MAFDFLQKVSTKVRRIPLNIGSALNGGCKKIRTFLTPRRFFSNYTHGCIIVCTNVGALMNLYEEIEKIKASGYSEQNAQSKLGQDIILKADQNRSRI